MTGVEASADISLSSAVEAADLLFRAKRGQVEHPYEEPDTVERARAAVARFGELFAGLPGSISDALDAAASSAELLSGDRLQGLSEIVQNADDVGATEVQLLLRPGELLVAHNGAPVQLRDVLALATPWLTTKAGESTSTGRFGIGLMTLRSLSRTLEVHCSPYHVRLGNATLTALLPSSQPEGVGDEGWTILRLPLDEGVLSDDELGDWLAQWDDSALLFLRHVERVVRVTPDRSIATRLQLRWDDVRSSLADVGGHPVEVTRRHARAQDDRSWLVYSVEAPAPTDVARTRKATGTTTPIAVALALQQGGGGVLYAGLPVARTRVRVRANAQFDPLASRQGLASTSWNAALLPLLADLWVDAVVDLFRTQPRAGWRVVPLPRPDGPDLQPIAVDGLEDLLVERARSDLTERLHFCVPGDAELPLSDLAAEVPRLERVLTAEQVASLAETPAALPSNVRDLAGRWRHVLDDWRSSGADLPDLVEVADALALLGDDLDAGTTVAIAAAAIECALGDDLAERPCAVTDDGRHLIPPTKDSILVLATEPVPLAEQLGMALRLHPPHLDGSDDAQTVLAWLRQLGALLDADDPVAVVRRLAAVGRAGHHLEEPLTDATAAALRGAFEMLTLADRNRFGSDVGQAILLRGYTYAKGRRTQTLTRPVDAYLPKSIERETGGFAEAAAETPGLTWLDRRYAEALRSPAGRTGVGPQRFLRLLGAETAPRLRPHPAREHRYSDPRLGVPARVSRGPRARQTHLDNIEATYTLDDHDSPDLQAVIVDIAREKAVRRRRKRAAALLTTLARAWDRLGEDAEVTAAYDYNTGNLRGPVRAFWLWQAGAVAWLDDADGTPSRPQDLRLRTAATVAVYGPDASGYLRRELDAPNHRVVLAALGVTGEPTTVELVDRLRNLRDIEPADDDPVADAHTEAAVVYQALAERVAHPARSTGQMGPRRMRAAFQQGAGLILTQAGWRRPTHTLSGPPVFGRLRAFVPAVAHTDDLWQTLHVPQPSARDCVDVLRELAHRKVEPVADDAAIMLDTLRLLVRTVTDDIDQSLKRRLGRLPLWTSTGWISTRPVYATDDPSLADGLGDTVPLWLPGATIEQFRSLIGPLLLTELGTADTEVIDSSSAEDDPDLTDLLQAAVRLLHDDLARNDQQAARSLTLAWSQLEQFRVRVDPDLTVRIRHAVARGLPATVEVKAEADIGRAVLFVRSADLAPKVDGGGRAIAGLFSAHHRRIAQAWRSAWDEAEAGREAEDLILADQRAAELEAQMTAEIAARLAALRDQVTERRRARTNGSGKREKPTPDSRPLTAAGPQEPPAARTLVDPTALRLRDPSGRVAGSAGRSSGLPSGRSRQRKDLVPPRTDGSPPHSHRSPPAYTNNSKESVGLELVVEVLGSDAEQIVDLRAQAGVGADAMDELRQFYELKVHAGSEPDRVTLTGSEAQRALTEPGFFLVVVSNVEGTNATPRVRIIANPLDQLQPTDNGSITLAGIREAHSIVFDFEKDEP